MQFKQMTASLAHYEPYFGQNPLLFHLVKLIELLQFTGMMLPSAINYDEETFYKLKILLEQLILDSNRLQESYIYIIFAVQLIFVILCILQHYLIIYYYFIALITIFKIPLYSVLIQQLILGSDKNILAFVFAVIAILFISLQILYIQYFIRDSTIAAKNILLRKHIFTDHLYLDQILCICSIIVYYQNTTYSLQLIAYIIYSIYKFITEFINRPYSYPYDQFNTSLSFIQVFFCLVLMINLISNNTFFPNGSLLLPLLISIPISCGICNQCYKLYNRYQAQDLIFYTQFLFYLETKPNLSQYEQLILQIEYTKHLPCQCKKQKIIQCLLKNATGLNNLLLYSDYSLYINNPMSGLIKLKQFHHSQKSNIYFQWTISSIYHKLEEEILQQQQEVMNHSESYKQITIHDLIKFQSRQDEIVQQIIRIQELKINFWEKQIQGADTIYQLKAKLLDTMQYVQNLQQLIEKEFIEEINFMNTPHGSKNILNMKFLSLFYAFVLNDPYRTYKCEYHIKNTLQYESSLTNNLITYLSCLEDRLIYVSISLIKNLGRITNKDKSSILKLFHYSNEDRETLQKVNQLMPEFIAKHHDSYLQNFKQHAKSQYFATQRLVFGQVKEGFLLPFQLKLLSDFTLMDDYAMQGMLFHKSNSSDYILFSTDFKILGTTQRVFEILLKQTSSITYESLIRLGYIYLLIPKIPKIVHNLRLQSQDSMADDSIFIWRPQLYDFLLGFTPQHTNIVSQSMSYSKTIKSLNYKDQKALNEYDPIFENSAMQYLKETSQMDTIYYTIHFNIYVEKIGQNENFSEYYVMELLDYRKQEQLTYSSTNQFNFSTLQTSMKNQASMQIDQAYEITQSDQFREPSMAKEENLQQQQEDSALVFHMNDQGISLRQSFSYGPTSRRALFVTPEMKALRDDSNQLFQEIYEIEHEIQSPREESVNIMKHLSDEQQKSQEKKAQSNQILKIMTEYKKQDKESLSTTTKTSSSNQFVIIQQFQYQKRASMNLILLIALNVSVFLIILTYLCVHASLLDTQYNYIVYAQNQVSGPLILSYIFTSLPTLPWLLIFQDKFNNSQLIQNSIRKQLDQLNQYGFSNLSTQYTYFINIEQENLLSQQVIDLRIYPSINVSYTEFINLLQNYANSLFNIQSTNITRQQMDSLLILRANINTIYSMNIQIVNSLNTIYQNNVNNFTTNHQSQIVLECTAVSILLMLQILLWRNIHIHDQIIILLLGRQQDQDLIHLINGAAEIKRLLLGNNIRQQWKRLNIYNFMYIDQIWKQEKYSSKQTKIKSQKSNYVNSRIIKTHINLIKHLIILTFTVGLIFAYFQGLQQIVLSQNQLVKPQQTLATNFLQVNLQINTLAALSIITKSEPLIWSYLKNNYNYTDKEIKFNQTSVFTLFSTLFSTFNVKFQTVFKGIILSTQLSDSDRSHLFNLYNGDICIFVTSIPFCQYDSLSDSAFIQKYGNYNIEDNNREFLKIGIIGIVSNMELLLKGSYSSEIQNKTYSQASQSDQNLFQTQLFINTLTEYFVDAFQALNVFYNILLSSILQILKRNYTHQYLYLFLGGLPLVVLYIVTYLIWINRTYEEMIKIRLGLLMMSTDSLLTPQTISVLRQLR